MHPSDKQLHGSTKDNLACSLRLSLFPNSIPVSAIWIGGITFIALLSLFEITEQNAITMNWSHIMKDSDVLHGDNYAAVLFLFIYLFIIIFFSARDVNKSNW